MSVVQKCIFFEIFTAFLVWDPYRQYLAYHEGWGGYSRGSYNKKPKLLKVAQKVKRQAEIYGAQLKKCRADLDKATKGWF